MSAKKIQEEIIQTLSRPVLPGGLKTYYNVCGKANCQCKHPQNPKPHGPYTQLSFSVGGKSSTISIPKTEESSTLKAVDNFKKLKFLVNELALANAEEARRLGASSLKSLTSCLSKGGFHIKAENLKLRQLRESQGKWKSKALKRHEELEKKRIKIRDLEKSRENWKAKAVKAKEQANELQKKLAAAEYTIKEFDKNVGGKKKLMRQAER